MSDRLPPEEGGYVLCRVEGCPRAFDNGQDEPCGLARLIGFQGNSVSRPLCGSDATVDAWEAAGLLSLAPLAVEIHRTEHER